MFLIFVPAALLVKGHSYEDLAGNISGKARSRVP